MSTKDTGPLDWRIAIVDKTGRPTQEFQRKWATQRANNALIGSITFGTGAPTGTPDDGAEYVDTTKVPWVFYIGENQVWNIVGVQDFTDLGDVPGNYTASGGKLVRVAGNATGLEFDSPSLVLDSFGNATGSVLYRGNSTWDALSPGTSGDVLTTGGPGAPPAWAPGGGGGGGGGGIWDLSAGVPAAAGFTQTNFSSGTTFTESPGKALIMRAFTAASNSLNVVSKAVPGTTPYRVALLCNVVHNGSNNWPFYGWRKSSGEIQLLLNDLTGINIQNYSNPTSFSGQPFAFTDISTNLTWIGLRDDGTNIFFERSSDGVNFATIYTTSKSSGFLGSSGYNEICFGLFDNDGNTNPILTIRVYDENGLTRTFP